MTLQDIQNIIRGWAFCDKYMLERRINSAKLAIHLLPASEVKAAEELLKPLLESYERM